MKTIALGLGWIVFFVVVIAGCEADKNREPTLYEKYQAACKEKGGTVSNSKIESWSISYKCISLERNRDDLLPEITLAG